MCSTVAIIQARMVASRLPNKMLLHFHGYPVVEWVYRRISKSKKIQKVIFALPDSENDDLLAWYLELIGANVFRGSELDLVDRFYQAAKNANATRVVRICADNPLICASEVDRLIHFADQHACDYAYNHVPRNNSWPDGLGAEICNMALLEEIHSKAILPEHREHLFNYVWQNSGNYKIATFQPPEALAHPELKLDIDTMNDYRRLLQIRFQIGMDAIEVVQTALSNTNLHE